MQTTDPSSLTSQLVFEELRKRFHRMPLPLWYATSDGSILEESLPIEWNQIASADIFQASLKEAVLTPMGASNIVDSPSTPGCWFIRTTLGTAGPSARQLVTAALDDRFFNDMATPRIGPFPMGLHAPATASTDEINRIAVMLDAMAKDVSARTSGDQTLSQFADRLSQAYEETNLLFRLGRLLNTVDEGSVVVQSLCSQIHQILPFSWIAIRFNESDRSPADLRGKLILAGDTSRIDDISHIASLIASEAAVSDSWTKILTPAGNPHAATLGSEIVAEPITHDGRVIGVLLAGDMFGDDPMISSFELQFLDAAADFLGIFHENIARFTEQREMFLGTVRALTASIDAKDPYTRGHSDRVGHLAAKMAAVLGLSAHLVERYRITGIVHDVGKIGVPEAVLCKQGKLTNEEFDHIKRHPVIGHDILRDVPSMQDLLPGVLHHHERWDGTGYPQRLAGEAIPLIGRVLALCDTFDAMSSNRSYRAAMARETILAEIRRCAGTQFDPQLAPIFASMEFASYDALLSHHTPQQAKAA